LARVAENPSGFWTTTGTSPKACGGVLQVIDDGDTTRPLAGEPPIWTVAPAWNHDPVTVIGQFPVVGLVAGVTLETTGRGLPRRVVVAFATEAIPDGARGSSVTAQAMTLLPINCGRSGTLRIGFAVPAGVVKPTKFVKSDGRTGDRVRFR
jgi:hypothetical protein